MKEGLKGRTMDLDTFIVAMLGVVAGGFVTFIVQRSIQERAWKKERAEEIYAPLLDQLGEVEANLNRLVTNPSYPEWRGLRERHLFHRIKPELKEKLWKFFDVELHNFNIGLVVAINLVSESVKKEILQKEKEEERGEIQRTTHYLRRKFLSECAKLVLVRYIGFGGIGTYQQLKKDYSELEKKYFEKRMPFNDFIENLASKIKDHPFFKEGNFKEELMQLITKTQELRREVEKEMNVREKREAW